METTVFLVRHGVTEWHEQGRLLGQRDLPLVEAGAAQASAVADALADVGLSDIVSSPLSRAVQTAEAIGARCGIQVARDPRLLELRVGQWEGERLTELEKTDAYRAFLQHPLETRMPGGETIVEVHRRALGALAQALEDTPAGEGIAVVSHASVIRLLLSHFAGVDLGDFHRFRVCPGSISVLSFTDDRAPPRLLAVNWVPALPEVLS